VAASTVHDRFQEWVRAGVFRRMWRAGLLRYDEKVGIGWQWQAMDGALSKTPLEEESRELSGHASLRLRLDHLPCSPDYRIGSYSGAG